MKIKPINLLSLILDVYQYIQSYVGNVYSYQAEDALDFDLKINYFRQENIFKINILLYTNNPPKN